MMNKYKFYRIRLNNVIKENAISQNKYNKANIIKGDDWLKTEEIIFKSYSDIDNFILKKWGHSAVYYGLTIEGSNNKKEWNKIIY